MIFYLFDGWHNLPLLIVNFSIYSFTFPPVQRSMVRSPANMFLFLYLLRSLSSWYPHSHVGAVLSCEPPDLRSIHARANEPAQMASITAGTATELTDV